jgi:hypothetical protein
MKKFAEEEPRNPIAKKWIEHEKSKWKTLKILKEQLYLSLH